MPISTEQILHPARYAAGDRPDRLVFVSPSPDTVRYEDGLGEFEIRLLLEQYLGDDSTAVLVATGWNGDRYRVLGRGADVLVWYTLWDDAAAGTRFFRGLERAWAKRRSGAGAGAGGRRSEVKQLVLSGVPVVRLVDAPARWSGWRHVPAVRVRRAAGKSPPLGFHQRAK